MSKTKENYKYETGFEVYSYFRTALNLKGSELLIYSLIYSFSHSNDGYLKASQQKIAKMLSMTVQTVNATLKKLKEKGLIEVESTHFQGNPRLARLNAVYNRYRVSNVCYKNKFAFKTIRSGDSFVVTYKMLSNNLTPVQVLIASRIRTYNLNGSSVCYASLKCLSEWCGCSIKTVQRTIKKLIKSGLLVKRNGLLLFKEYYINDENFDIATAKTLDKIDFYNKDKFLIKYLEHSLFKYKYNFLYSLTYRFSSMKKQEDYLSFTYENNEYINTNNRLNITLVSDIENFDKFDVKANDFDLLLCKLIKNNNLSFVNLRKGSLILRDHLIENIKLFGHEAFSILEDTFALLSVSISKIRDQMLLNYLFKEIDESTAFGISSLLNLSLEVYLNESVINKSSYLSKIIKNNIELNYVL